ncbi:MAG: hypothetical protein RLZZ15_283 [Verrucomicrobiota bacterium]|jgi:hypothetical protein
MNPTTATPLSSSQTSRTILQERLVAVCDVDRSRSEAGLNRGPAVTSQP